MYLTTAKSIKHESSRFLDLFKYNFELQVTKSSFLFPLLHFNIIRSFNLYFLYLILVLSYTLS